LRTGKTGCAFSALRDRVWTWLTSLNARAELAAQAANPISSSHFLSVLPLLNSYIAMKVRRRQSSIFEFIGGKRVQFICQLHQPNRETFQTAGGAIP
jgi:hypothetical protein